MPAAASLEPPQTDMPVAEILERIDRQRVETLRVQASTQPQQQQERDEVRQRREHQTDQFLDVPNAAITPKPLRHTARQALTRDDLNDLALDQLRLIERPASGTSASILVPSARRSSIATIDALHAVSKRFASLSGSGAIGVDGDHSWM